MITTQILLVIIAATLVTILVSFLVEAIRRAPEKPGSLYWSDSIPIQYVEINGVTIRYIKSGTGPVLVLLHTIRSQLDLFEKVIPSLSDHFTVYAMDYPSHGFSDTVPDDQTPDMFTGYVEKFLEILDIREGILAGVSIGGTIPLIIASRHNPRVKGVVAINPYDYNRGLGVRRGNFLAWLIITLVLVPVVGETVMRLRIKLVEKIVFQGGVVRKEALTPEFIDLVYHAGDQDNRYRGFINLFRNGVRWEDAHEVYGKINVPVKVVYGEDDWSNDKERQQTISEIPRAQSVIVRDGGHFLAMDRPDAVIDEITGFARTLRT